MNKQKRERSKKKKVEEKNEINHLVKKETALKTL